MFFKKDRSINMSLPPDKVLYGVRIHKLPVAKYISALNAAENLPQILLGEVLPEVGSAAELLDKLISSDIPTLQLIVTKLLVNAPAEFCRVISILLDIPSERLLDPKCKNPLAAYELLQIMLEFWKVNDMSDFFSVVRRLVKRVKPAAQTKANTGFRGGLQSPKA